MRTQSRPHNASVHRVLVAGRSIGVNVLAKQIDEEFQRLYGVRLQEGDPREFAKYHRLAAFDLDEVYGANATVSKFAALPHPIHQGFYGADIDHMDMMGTGVLGWRVPASRAELAVVKYEGERNWLGRRKFEYALFVRDTASSYLAVKGAAFDAAVPMLVRGLNALGGGS